jgi:peptide/nickel transport system permease protein
MQQYILRRVLISVPVLLVISIMTYGFANLVPGDPVSAMADPELLAGASGDALRERMGLLEPVHVRYLIWLREVLQGNLGYSYHSHEAVLKTIGRHVLPTLELTSVSFVLSVVFGTLFGVIAAIRQYSAYDYALSLVALIGVSIPTFFFALLALYLFAFVWEIFPSHGMGYVPGEGLSFRLNIYHLLLPALVLSIDTMAGKTRYARTAMLEVLKADYVTTARAKGLPEQVVVLRHGFRNALIPLITVTMLRLPGLFGGALLVEAIFTWPGMGQLTIQAVGQRDYPMIMGLTMIVSSLVLLANLAADLLYAYADPRVRVNA